MSAAEDLEATVNLLNLLDQYAGQVIIEDGTGAKYNLTEARLIGANTDDPGIVLKIQPLGPGLF